MAIISKGSVTAGNKIYTTDIYTEAEYLHSVANTVVTEGGVKYYIQETSA